MPVLAGASTGRCRWLAPDPCKAAAGCVILAEGLGKERGTAGTRAEDGSILVADSDAAARAAIREALVRAGYEVREAASGVEALQAVKEELPRLVVLEVALDEVCGYEVCRHLREEFGEGLPIVFLSGERAEALDRVAGLLIGADDYVVKPFVADELVARIRRLLRRAPVVPAAAAKLTTREMEILRLLADGLEQDEIARRLVITRKTVGTHIEHILAKLGVRTRAQAVALAYRDDLVERASRT